MAVDKKESDAVNWHLLTAEQTASQLHVEFAQGLGLDEVADHQETYGPNAIITSGPDYINLVFEIENLRHQVTLFHCGRLDGNYGY